MVVPASSKTEMVTADAAEAVGAVAVNVQERPFSTVNFVQYSVAIPPIGVEIEPGSCDVMASVLVFGLEKASWNVDE